MQPDLELEQIAPELIGTGAQAVVENAKRLGLTWTITPATITSVDPVEAIVDGDTVAIGMVSMIGSVFLGQRVYVIQAPPSGNFIAGSITGVLYKDSVLVRATTTSISFNNIPSDLKSVEIRWSARVAANGAVFVHCRINNDATAGIYVSTDYGTVGAAYSAVTTLTSTSGLIGVCGGNNNANEYSGGRCLWTGWNAPHPSRLNWVSQSFAFVFGIFQGARSQGGAYGGAAPYRSIQIFEGSGAGFEAGSEFDLIGIW